MTDHPQQRANIADVEGAWQRLRELFGKHLPANTRTVTNNAYTVGTKRSLWP